MHHAMHHALHHALHHAIHHALHHALHPYNPQGEELKEKVGGDALAFFGESEVLPEPKSSVTGVATDGLGGYASDAYAMDESGKDPGFDKK